MCQDQLTNARLSSILVWTCVEVGHLIIFFNPHTEILCLEYVILYLNFSNSKCSRIMIFFLEINTSNRPREGISTCAHAIFLLLWGNKKFTVSLVNPS